VGRELAESPVQCFVERAKPFNSDVVEIEIYPPP
jgi:hypothetical protein